MPDTLTEPELQDALPPESLPPRRRWLTRLPIAIASLLVFFWLANVAISLLITHTRLQNRITGRLERVFGRPVTVGRYDFSLWGGPTLGAADVTFAEDPRFGHEYFLRAESLTVRLRWQSLLRGHMDLGTVSLVRPSLNLVRNAEGDWNLAEWLPRPSSPANSISPASGTPGATANSSSPAVRFTRLEVDSGRINFKRGDEKIPFAFTGVNGFVEPDGPGRWRVNLEAVPSRAAVALQTPGTIYLSGSLGGTSSRLRPAALDLAWGGASIPDVLRLFRGYDFGVRGNLALVIHAETQGDDWNLQSRAQAREVHRWDLPIRADNPALDLNAKMILHPLVPSLDIVEATADAPASSARVTGHFDWSGAAQDSQTHHAEPDPNRLEVAQGQIDLRDALAWLRGFQPDVASDLTVTGNAGVSANFQGWPPRLATSSAVVKSAELASPRLRVPARLSQFQLRYDGDRFLLPPATIFFGSGVTPENPASALRLETVSASPRTTAAADEAAQFHLAGSIPQVRDAIATAGALGWNISRGWDLSGPMRCDLRWPANSQPWKSQPVGTLEWGTETGNAALLTPFLNQPVEQIRARADLRSDSRRINLTAATAFGSRWNGSFDSRDDGAGWQFSLFTAQLSVADLDRWLNPRWRESFIYRVLPFLNSSSPTNSVPENLRASGNIAIDELTVATDTIRHLRGELNLGGRHLELTNAKSQFAGGSLDGSFDVQLKSTPSYRIDADFSRVDLASLTAASPALASLFGGSVSGEMALHFAGASRGDILSSLGCTGAVEFSEPEIRSLNLIASVREGALRSGASAFPAGSATFTCAQQKINFQTLTLASTLQGVEGSGSVGLDGAMNLQMHEMQGPAGARTPRSATAPTTDLIELTGTLAKPAVKPAPVPAQKP